MPAWHLAPGPAIPAWDTFVSAYPLFSANLHLQTPTSSLCVFLQHFSFKTSSLEKELFRWIFFRKKIQKACECKRGKFDYCLESTSWYSAWLFLSSGVMHRQREIICIYRGRKVFGCLQCLQQTFRYTAKSVLFLSSFLWTITATPLLCHG